MLREMAERGERAAPKHAAQFRDGPPADGKGGVRPTSLEEMGITYKQSSRWQALAAMPDEHFETAD